MIKYNEITHKDKKICLISEEKWEKNGKTYIPHRNANYSTEIEGSLQKYGRVSFKEETTQFGDDELIMPYLISRFGLENIYYKDGNKTIPVLLNNLYKKLIRDEKTNKI